MSEIEIAFTELFYGAGAWLGLLLLLAIITVLSLKTRYLGMLMIPVTIFLGIEYLDYPSLMWHALIMFISAIFFVLTLFRGRDE